MDPLGWAFAAKWAFAPDLTVYGAQLETCSTHNEHIRTV